MYLTVENYFQKYKISHLSEYQEIFGLNSKDLISRCNTFFQHILQLSPVVIPIVQSSGWRPPSVNATISQAKMSYHTIGKAIDISDPQKLLQKLILEYPHLLKLYGLWLESPDDAIDHIHIDVVFRSERPVNIFKA